MIRYACLTVSLLFGAVLLIACQKRLPTEETLLRQDGRSSRDFVDDADMASLQKMLIKQWDHLERQLQRDPHAVVDVAGRQVTVRSLASHYRELVRFLQTQPSKSELSQWLWRHFMVYRYRGTKKNGQILVTGYFLPEYRAAREPSPRFRHPIYPVPEDKKPGRRYHTREEIDYRGVLRGKAKPLAWLENDIERFFLQVQGSGRLIWPDGSSAIVGYAGDNGHDYVSLGKLLIADGVLQKQGMSMQTIDSYFTANPKRFRRYAARMPRYIFFKFKDYVEGASGLAITPMRTIAVDTTRIPLGLLAYLSTSKPLDPTKPLSLFVVSQDTGGGVRGDHVDLYWGAGAFAGEQAGHMKASGILYLLLPKSP